VERYTRLVYSTALRQVDDAHAAQDITQLVFTHLAQKAGALSRRVVIGGWLYRDAVFTASKYRRSMQRRRVREEEAARMTDQSVEDAASTWNQVAPFVDEALERLGENDRNAIVLRFFEGQPLRSVGDALGISEDAARMRVDRAVEKLRRFLVGRGVAVSAAGLAAILGTSIASAAPENMAPSIAANALGKARADTGFQLDWPDWMTSKAFFAAMASIVSISLAAGLVWQSVPRATLTATAAVAQKLEVSSIEIRGGVRRTTKNPTSMYFFIFTPLTIRPGEQVTVTNTRGPYRITLRSTIEADTVLFEASLAEGSTDPASATVVFPSVKATNGEQVVVSNGIYSFEFRPTFALQK
jgi:RNA polymerase sigma factor (sigma-70 family)